MNKSQKFYRSVFAEQELAIKDVIPNSTASKEKQGLQPKSQIFPKPGVSYPMAMTFF